jgi:2-(1,2-epoxy-1,2-dihydrophenyl)acetyl-CoA isomerase
MDDKLKMQRALLDHLEKESEKIQLLDLEARRQIETGRTQDHKEAARAFVEKRAPVFTER